MFLPATEKTLPLAWRATRTYRGARKKLVRAVVAGAALISIVDDDPWVRGGLEAFVASVGYGVRSFKSAAVFIESGSIAESACVIVDLNMPGMSGLDLQSYVRAKGHKVPIILTTGYPTEDRPSLVTDHLTCFLAKPIDEQALIDCLARVVGPRTSAQR